MFVCRERLKTSLNLSTSHRKADLITLDEMSLSAEDLLTFIELHSFMISGLSTCISGMLPIRASSKGVHGSLTSLAKFGPMWAK